MGRDRRFNRPWPPLSLLNTAALLNQAGHTVRVIDLRAAPFSSSEIENAADSADFILLTSSPLDRWQCPNLDLQPWLKFARGLPGDKLIISGAHGTVYPDRILEETGARWLIRGEPEPAVAEFIHRRDLDSIPGVSRRNGRDIRHNPDGNLLDLDRLPMPAYDLIDSHLYFYELLGSHLALLETSRGCPFRCPFCFQAMYGSRYRIKSVDRVISEVRNITKNGFQTIYFIDLEFILDRERARSLCRGLSGLNRTPPWACQTRLDSLDEELLSSMARAGCRLIHIGLETGTDQLQGRISKPWDPEKARSLLRKAHAAGIATACFYLIGFPGETPAQRRSTLDLALRVDSTYASFHVLTPYPTTPYFERHCGGMSGFPACLPDTDGRTSARWAKKALLRYYLRPGHMRNMLRLQKRRGSLLSQIKLLKEVLW